MNTAAKDFAPIESDYDFFMSHSTEAAGDVRDYLPHVQKFAGWERPVRMLDFGCGGGDFSEAFLSASPWGVDQQERVTGTLELSLVEPVAHLRQRTAARLQKFAARPIAHAATLAELPAQAFDFILANHTFYYVDHLAETVAALLETLQTEGLFLTALAGRDNAMQRFLDRGFGALQKPIPYHLADEFTAALNAVTTNAGATYVKEQSPYVISFPDSPENRLRILRFLCADHLAQMPQQEMLADFDDFAHDGQIVMPTHAWHFVIRR